jgi:carboxymethylenebutenolidase
MIEREVDIDRTDGAMNTFITHPEEGGPHPIIAFLMDAPGKREELHDMARRLGTVGYYVMLPNLYYRRERNFKMGADDDARRIMFEHMNSLSNAMVCEDITALFDFADGDFAARKGPAGTVGYCMSGPFAFAAAAAHKNRIRAAASLHGVSLCTDAADSPHLALPEIEAELYFGCAETDSYAPPEMIEKLEVHLKEASANARVEWYPGTQHGFVFPKRVGMYEKHAAERHWERLFDLFDRNL